MEAVTQQDRMSDNRLESSSAESFGALGTLVHKLSVNTWVDLLVRKVTWQLACAEAQLAS